MKFKKMNYRIHDFKLGHRNVTGYAIDFPDVKLCVREKSRRHWEADHYDSGFAINTYYPFPCTRQQAAEIVVECVKQKIASGDYAKAIRRANRDRS